MLKRILDHKRVEAIHMTVLERDRTRPIRPFAAALTTRPFICEIKRRSPSRGTFPAVNPADRARLYADAGAGAISVLTDQTFFGGGYDDLTAVSQACGLPVLCKDFVVAPVQVENAFRAGADAVLLIAAALDDGELTALSRAATARGLTVLYEVHTVEDLARVMPLKPRMVGVNARNLATLSIDLDRAAALMRQLPKSVMRVAESGLHRPQDVARMRAAGADAFLVGTALMTAPDPATQLARLHTGLSTEKEAPCS